MLHHLMLFLHRPAVSKMAAEDKHGAEAAARNLSPGQLVSLFKMEPKTLGVSRNPSLHALTLQEPTASPLWPSAPPGQGRSEVRTVETQLSPGPQTYLIMENSWHLHDF